MNVGNSQCSNPLTNLAEFWTVQSNENCCLEFHPCDDGKEQVYDFGDGTIQHAGAGEVVTHCYCQGDYEVTHSVFQGTQLVASYTEDIIIDGTSCDQSIDVSFDYNITGFVGCTDPTLCCCGDCDVVTVVFTDNSVSNYSPIVYRGWNVIIHTEDWSFTKILKNLGNDPNPTFEIGDGLWNGGYKISAHLLVENDCGETNYLRYYIKTNC